MRGLSVSMHRFQFPSDSHFRLSMSWAVRDDLSVQCSAETTSIGQRDHYFVYFRTALETASAWFLNEIAVGTTASDILCGSFCVNASLSIPSHSLSPCLGLT